MVLDPRDMQNIVHFVTAYLRKKDADLDLRLCPTEARLKVERIAERVAYLISDEIILLKKTKEIECESEAKEGIY